MPNASSSFARALRKRCGLLLSLSVVAGLLISCGKKQNETGLDNPRLTPTVVLRDVTFHSPSLNRDMQYRVILPAQISRGEKLPVVYLLHGGGGGFRDWSNFSDIARFAEQGWILVMPEGHSSYYTNSAEKPADLYEDYIVKDLIADVQLKFPAADGRQNRAVAGVSMGGFGAVKLALRYPKLYFFAGGLSPAVDVPSRPFSIKRLAQWRFHSSIFGPWGSPTRRDNDPFLLAQSASPEETPYLYLTCGEQESLLPANRKVVATLEKRHFQYEFHTVPGDHNWLQWNEQIPDLLKSLQEHLNPKS